MHLSWFRVAGEQLRYSQMISAHNYKTPDCIARKLRWLSALAAWYGGKHMDDMKLKVLPISENMEVNNGWQHSPRWPLLSNNLTRWDVAPIQLQMHHHSFPGLATIIHPRLRDQLSPARWCRHLGPRWRESCSSFYHATRIETILKLKRCADWDASRVWMMRGLKQCADWSGLWVSTIRGFQRWLNRCVGWNDARIDWKDAWNKNMRAAFWTKWVHVVLSILLHLLSKRSLFTCWRVALKPPCPCCCR